MHIDVLHPQELDPAQLARWSQLQAQDPRLDSPFLSPQWARAVARAQGDGCRARVAVAGDAGRDLAFLAVSRRGGAALPIGAPMNDCQGLVGTPGLVLDPRRLVAALGADCFDFSEMLADEAAFAPFARGRDWSHVVEVGSGYEAYAAERRAAGVGVLKDCDRKRRKAAREAGEPVFTAFSRSATDFAQLIAWKRAQLRATGQTDILSADWTQRLLDELFESREPDFGGALFTLHLGDRLAAAHFHLHGRRTIHAWLIAYDPSLERYSPGLLLFQDILRWMEATPYTRLALGPGDYRFKRELANAGLWTSHGFVGRPSAAALVRSAAYGLRRAAEALPLGPVSELPGKAMRRVERWRALRSA